MIIKIYIATVVIAFISLLSAELKMDHELKSMYGKSYKRFSKKSNTTWFANVLAVLLPIVNIAFACVFAFGYGKIRDSYFKDIEREMRRIDEQSNIDG